MFIFVHSSVESAVYKFELDKKHVYSWNVYVFRIGAYNLFVGVLYYAIG